MQEKTLLVLYLAAMMNGLIYLLSHWSYHAKKKMSYNTASSVSNADTILIIPQRHKGKAEFAKIQFSTELQRLFFVFQKRKFFFNKENGQFERRKNTKDISFEEYRRGGLTEKEARTRKDEIGENAFDIPIPKFLELFLEHAVAPFFVFQVISVLLWMLDEYWYYGIFTLLMLVIFECGMVQQRIMSLKEFRKMDIKPMQIKVCRDGQWNVLNSRELVPGDLCLLEKKDGELTVPCDLLLLSGECVVNEAMISGESTPLIKEECPEKGIFVGKGEDKTSMLFNGTTIVTINGRECLCSVLRTGFDTVQGKLVRTMLFSSEVASSNNKDAFLLISFLLFVAVSSALYAWFEGVKDVKRERFKLFIECLLMVTSVVPVELPIEMSLVVNQAVIYLASRGIVCTEPFRIPMAGKIQFCCLDKTGTITDETLLFEGLFLRKGESKMITKTIATCHSLVWTENGVGGDPMECSLFDSTKCKLNRNNTVQSADGECLKIHKRNHFNSKLRRMSSVWEDKQGKFFASVKGAPETIKEMLVDAPTDFEEEFKRHASYGKRVIVVAYRKITRKEQESVLKKTFPRSRLECGLTFCCFAVFSAPVKKDSKQAISNLVASNHRVIVVTGDTALTANHVAKKMDLVADELALVDQDTADESVFRISYKEKTRHVELEELETAFDGMTLSMTGDAFEKILEMDRSIAFSAVLRCIVFSRCSPRQKEELVLLLKERGVFSLMCGDGTNDVGALKQSTVGVALLNGRPEDLQKILFASKKEELKRYQQEIKERFGLKETKESASLLLKEESAQTVKFGDASIAAPFTSRISTLESVCDIIRQGRSSLVTTAQSFKILGLNSLVSAFSMCVLNIEGVRYGDRQSTLMGMLLTFCSIFLSHSKASKKLSKKRPNGKIVTFGFLFSTILQSLVHLSVLWIVSYHAKRFSFNRTLPPKSPFEASLLNSSVFVVSLFLQLSTIAVNYIGAPFKDSIMENTKLRNTLLCVVFVTVALSLGFSSDLNTLFELVPLPLFVQKLIVVCGLSDILVCLLIERFASNFVD